MDFNNLLPIAMKITAQTIGMDLLSVHPIGGGNTSDEIKKIKAEVKAENRDRKLDSILGESTYEEMKIEEHSDYKKGSTPSGDLYYIDFKYDK